MKFSVTPLEKALTQLETSLQYMQNAATPELREQFRAAVIQAFEFSFELSWKMIKRYLEQFSLEKVDGFTAKQLFRVAHEQGLITCLKRSKRRRHDRPACKPTPNR